MERTSTMLIDLGHHFDGVGVCCYCHLCNDEWCCPRVLEPCSKIVLTQLNKSTEEIDASDAD
jgi:hypothetical protein